MAELKLDSEALNAMVIKSIVDSITDEQRQGFIAAAVRQIITPAKNAYGYSRAEETPLQTAFADAVRAACHTTAIEMVDNSPELMDLIRSKISEIVADAITGGTSYNPLRTAIAEGVGAAVESALEKARH